MPLVCLLFQMIKKKKKDRKGKRHERADKARIVAASVCATKARRVAETFKSECRGRAGNRVGGNPKEKRRPSDQTGVLQVRDPLLSTSVIPTDRGPRTVKQANSPEKISIKPCTRIQLRLRNKHRGRQIQN